MIPIHYPQEHWCSGRHTILLYYPIENVMANFTNTFNVYMRCTGGSATVDTGFCIASISGQSMGADAAWDGKIEVEEYVERFPIGTGSLSGRPRGVGFTGSTMWEIDELVKRFYSDELAFSALRGDDQTDKGIKKHWSRCVFPGHGDLYIGQHV